MADEYALALNSVTVRYDQKIAIFKVSLELEKGKLHVLMGPNGGGKTTLIRAAAGLIPYRGEIKIYGIDSREYLRRHAIGYLAQRGSTVYDFPMTALGIVEMGRYRFRESRESKREKAMEFLDEVDMAQYAHSPIGKLSGGQQQRVLIARALATESKLLLLDEPLTGMDPRSQSKFYDMLDSLKKKHELTILMSNHDVGFTTAYAENVMCINKELVPREQVARLFSEPEVEKLYGPNICLIEHHHLPSKEEDDV